LSREQIRQACDLLFYPGQVVELRAIGDNGIHIGYFSNFDRFATDADMLDNSSGFKGIYFTLNPANPALLSRKANRISRQGKNDVATADGDIIRRRWFPVDIDPKRPSGISSSDEEHEGALTKARKIQGFLSELGWPLPVYADSGNGAHLLYRIDLPNDTQSGELVKTCLTVLSQFFSDEQSDVDLSVFNPSRIWKVYGTVSRKGDNTDERPHRRSAILSCPDEVAPVPVSELMHLASLLGPVGGNEGRNNRDGARSESTTGSLDLADWLTGHGLSYTEKPYSGGRLYLFDDCPFSSAHKDGAYAIQFDNGAIFAGCHHNSCGGGEQRWPELRERFDGGRCERGVSRASQMTSEEYDQKRKADARERARLKQERNGDGRENGNHADQGEDTRTPPDISLSASRILRSEKPIQYLLDSFAKDHEGDEVVAKCLIMSLASRSVVNSNGLHVLVTGESGKGKSHAFDTMLQHIPPEYRLDGRMSDKALFYADDLRPGSAICLDDVSLSEPMQEVLKGVTSAFQKGFVYRTVDKERKGQKRLIPERCLWWVAKMEGTGDDQVWNRMLTCWIDDSPEQDEKVLARELAAVECLPTDSPGTREEVLVCQQIWNQMTPVYVVIPYGTRIRFSSSANRRNPGMLLDLIKSIAALHQFQRDRVRVKDMEVIYANTEDFTYACQMYQALNGESGGQMSKLTRSESELLTAIRDSGRFEMSIADMQVITSRSYSTIYKMIHGYNSHGNHYSGLLEKCPALSFLDRTDVTDGGETSRRVRVYTWNPEIYLLWSSGGGCWLDNTKGGKEDGDDHDGGDGGCLQQVADDLRTNNTGDEAADCENTHNNKNNFYYSTSLRKNEDAYGTPEHVPSHAPEPAVSAITPPGSPSIEVPPAGSQSDEITGMKHLPQSSDEPEGIPLSSVDPDEYSPINGVWSGPCAVCGGKYVQYTEKFSPKMKEEGRFSHKICQKCYSKAVARVCRSFIALPGLINTLAMIPADKDYGRCRICNQGGVTWYDHETKTGICEICYTRERGRSGVMV